MDKKLNFYLDNVNYKQSPKKYLNPKTSHKWSIEETNLFYDSLSICGLDFSLINQIFTNKTRKQIKNKFFKEEKINKEKIEMLIKSRKGFSIEEFENLKSKNSEKIKSL